MSTKLTYTGAEVQELLDKIEKGDFDNAKTLEGHPASYFAIASEFTSLAKSFATEQGRINNLYSYFNNGSANDALRLGGQLPSYYATASQYEILQQTLSDFKSLFDSMFEKDSDGNIHAKLSLWSSGGITAGGVGSGGSGGGGASYDRLDSWSDYSADKAGYVLSALLGKDLDNRVSALANAGYITASYLAPYALRSEIPSLVGYATESFVTSRGYITASALGGYASQSWVESKNYLTGITSSMVTTALGYTPYNSANFTKANIKSTLGISDWALASAKPIYTASEVGALSVNGGDIGGSLNFRNGSSITCANGIVLEMYAGVDTYLRGSSNIYISAPNVYTQRNVYTYKVLDSGNYSDYALSVNGGTVNGSITATSFIGNLTGNADSASCVTGTANYANVALGENKVRLISNQTGNVGDFPKSWVSGLSVMSNYVGWQMVSYAGVDANPYFRKIADTGTWSEWKELAFLDDITGGMADYYGSRVASANVEFTDSAVRKLISTSSMTISKPPADGSILHFAWDNDGGWNHQLFLGSSSAVPPEQRMAWRAQRYRTWGEWKSLLFEDSNTITPSSGLLTVTGQANITTSLTTPVINTNTLKVGNITLVEENGALKVIGGLVATGGVTSGEKQVKIWQ